MTADAYTFSTSSWGGREAVIGLGDTIARMRRAHPDAVPIVELRAREMPTKWGKKSKPVLKVVGWNTAGDEGGPGVPDTPNAPRGGGRPAPVERLMPATGMKQAEGQVHDREIVDGDIPF